MTTTLHLTNAYHHASGGIRTFYHALLASAPRARWHVRLIVPSEDTRVEEVNAWARIYHLKAPRSLFIDRRYRLLLPYKYLFSRSSLLWSILHRERPDLIEICDKYSLVHLGGLVRRRWIPGQRRPAMTALTCERMDDNVGTFLSRRAVAQRFSRWYMRPVYMPQFDAHLAVSPYTTEELVASRRPVMVVPMGLDLDTFANVPRRADDRTALFGRAVADPRAVVLLYVGRLSREKGLPVLIDALEALAGDSAHVYHLVLAGDGPLREAVAGTAALRCRGRLHLLGHIADRRRLASCYANADLLVHPNEREPYGLVPLEAMASGLPVVLPRAGGVLAYASDDNAWLATVHANGFVAAIRSAVADVTRRRARVERARATAASLDWSCVIDNYFRRYDQIIADSAATRPVTEPRWWHAAALA